MFQFWGRCFDGPQMERKRLDANENGGAGINECLA